MPHTIRFAPLLLLPVLTLTSACQHAATSEPSQPATASVDEPADAPSVPQTIAFEPSFSGEPLHETELSADVRLETFAEGSGTRATPGTRVSFVFSGYDAATGQRVMGTQDWPAKMLLGATPSAPLDVLMQEALTDQRPGAQVRVHVPAVLANAGRSEREPKIGDLWITVTVTDVDEPQPPRDLKAFEGTPIASHTRGGGLEVHDYAEGEGIKAEDGDRVEFHYVVTSNEGENVGEVLLSTHAEAPVELTLGRDSGVPGLARGLRGAKVGTLRKLVVPAELGFDDYAPEGFPRNVATVMYVEVTRIDPSPDREL